MLDSSKANLCCRINHKQVHEFLDCHGRVSSLECIFRWCGCGDWDQRHDPSVLVHLSFCFKRSHSSKRKKVRSSLAFERYALLQEVQNGGGRVFHGSIWFSTDQVFTFPCFLFVLMTRVRTDVQFFPYLPPFRTLPLFEHEQDAVLVRWWRKSTKCSCKLRS